MEERSKRQKQTELSCIKQEESIYNGPLLSVYKQTIELANGKKIVSDLVKHPGAVAIIPINADGKILLIKQWRRAAKTILLEIPAGKLEKNENPLDCADRELREETGFKAKSLISLGGIYTAPGFCDEYIHLFLAKDLVEDPLWAEDSDHIDVIPVSLEETKHLALKGELIDSKTLSALYLYQSWMGETHD